LLLQKIYKKKRTWPI